MPKKKKIQLEVEPDVSVEVPVQIQEPQIEPEPVKKVEKVNYTVVDINDKKYKKFHRSDGTTDVELIG